MATRTIYLTVRLDIDNPKADEITDEEVDEIISEVDYEFKNYGDYEIDTEICGKMTKVVFRRYPDGQVIALFPDIPWSGRRGEITSYMHVGQHGAADYAGVIAMTRPAHEKEYRNPLSELRAIGYDDLHIMRRARPKFINS